MPEDLKSDLPGQLRDMLQTVAICLLAILALALAGATALSAAGALPWLSLPARLGDTVIDVGPALQSGLALTFLAILALVPGTARVRRLEAAHREFRVGMEDVTRAYWAAHAADRAGVFALHREFDAVRERFEFLRRHPDLSELEPELLELAAQMSTEARELARLYSDEKVARAEAMLLERRTEADRTGRLIERAHVVTRDLRRALAEVEMEEDVLRSRIAMLRDELEEIWSEIDGPGSARPEPRLRVAAE